MYTLIECDLKNGGSAFEGWYDNPEREGKPVSAIVTSETAYFFYAKWSSGKT